MEWNAIIDQVKFGVNWILRVLECARTSLYSHSYNTVAPIFAGAVHRPLRLASSVRIAPHDLLLYPFKINSILYNPSRRDQWPSLISDQHSEFSLVYLSCKEVDRQSQAHCQGTHYDLLFLQRQRNSWHPIPAQLWAILYSTTPVMW